MSPQESRIISRLNLFNRLEFVQLLSHLEEACQLLMILESLKAKMKCMAKEALGKLGTQLEFTF